MARGPIDRDKLRVHLRKLRKEELLDLLDRAIDLVPGTRLTALIEGHVAPGELRPDPTSAGGLPEAVREFRDASLRGDYYEGFDVNSKNFMEMSRGTETWIAECNRLFDRCVAAVKNRGPNEAREGFEILFDLLRQIDEGDDDILFFADEAGSWQVSANWRPVLPAYFSCLAAAADPEDYARTAMGVIDDFVEYDRGRYLRAARSAASPAQKKALRDA